MRPTRRVLLGIGVLLLAIFLGLLVTWHFQSRALGEALVLDAQAALKRTTPRDPKPAAPKHENGYACFVAMVEVTPKDLGLFELKNSDAFKAVLDGGVVPDEVQQKTASLAPWAESLRSCGDSAQLQFVEGVMPFTTQKDARAERGTQVVLALARLTRLEAKVLASEGQWESIVARCAGTLEVALDRSHLNLIGAMVAAGAVRQLAPPCGEALQHVRSEEVARRFAALPGRLAANHEFLELERLVMSLEAYGWLLTDEQRAKAPPFEHLFAETLENPLLRFSLARLWPRYDRAMRQLIAAADVPGPARREASAALDAAFNAWWLPGPLNFAPSYDKFLERSEDTMVLLRLLESLASGGTKPLPAEVVNSEAGLEFTDSRGEKVVVAR